MTKKTTLKLAGNNAHKRSNYDLSQSHLTTMDFGYVQPILSKEMLPGDSFNVKNNIFVRMAPLVKPVFGRMYWNQITSFVPYCQLDDFFDAFITGEVTQYGVNTKNPLLFKMCDLMDALGNDVYTTTLYGKSYQVANKLTKQVTPGGDERVDFQYMFSNNLHTCQFTSRGKVIYKWLRTLGYDLSYANNQSVISNDISDYKLNAYPLLAACKAYYDFFSRSSMYNMSLVGTILSAIRQRTLTSIRTDGLIPSSMLGCLLNSIADVMYENDYFTSAWASPNSVLPTTNGTNMQASLSGTHGILDNVVESTPEKTFVVPGSSLSQRSLDWLRNFDKYVRRGQYIGQKSINRIYQMFGVKANDMKSVYADLISRSSTPFTVGDVTALSGSSPSTGIPTAEGVLGDYSGKGIASNGDKYTFKAYDYGQLITFVWLSVSPVYRYGLDKSILRNQALDWYNGDFDDQTAMPISVAELSTNRYQMTSTEIQKYMQTYGFTERYNEYRYGRDQISGDFDFFDSMDVWHFGRDFNANIRAQSSDMLSYLAEEHEVTGKVYSKNLFDRIFGTETTGEFDHFYVTAYFDINASRPIASLSEATGLMTDSDNEIEKNGSIITE